VRKLAPVVLVLALASVGHAAEWCAGVIHLHTTYSDGDNSPTELRGLVRERLNGFGAPPHTFMMVTDHFEVLDGKRRQAHKPYSSYRPTIQALSVPGQFLAMPCLELAAAWQAAGQDVTANCHTLALGVLPPSYPELAAHYVEHPLVLEPKFGAQRELLSAVRAMGMLPIAAHPDEYGRVEIHVPKSLMEVMDYRFDQRPENWGDLAGVEVMNELVSSQDEEDIHFYLRVVATGRPVCVTAGADFHGTGVSPLPQIPVKEILKCLQRFTYVYVDSFDEAGIQAGMAAGRTYAARFGARLDSISPMVGEHAVSSSPTISAAISLHGEEQTPKEILIYRDGVLVEGSRKEWGGKTRSTTYEWTDPDAKSGEEHSYVLRVGEVLLTSPMYVRVP
jgi:hypothetical protein